MKKPEIEYPVLWQYKIIGQKKDEILIDVKKVLQEKNYSVEDSKSSSGGKYLSLNVSVTVDSEAERNAIFKNLHSAESIKIVI